jgi:hypothetical protein
MYIPSNALAGVKSIVKAGKTRTWRQADSVSGLIALSPPANAASP